MAKVYDVEHLGDAHLAILSRIVPGSRVLDVGCAVGYFASRLVADLGCQVVGVEVSEEAANRARDRGLDVIVGDITSEVTWSRVTGTFNYIVFADVLEHLADPWRTLRLASPLLAAGGRVIASVPNIAFRKVRLDLLLGRFEYTETGTLDDTHLRFFTRKSAVELFERSGYVVTAVIPTFKSRRDVVLSRLAVGPFAFHYVVEGYPRDKRS